LALKRREAFLFYWEKERERNREKALNETRMDRKQCKEGG
jgi:hypothetical protein